MSKRLISLLVCFCVILTIFICGCKSTPEEVPEETTPVEEAVVEETPVKVEDTSNTEEEKALYELAMNVDKARVAAVSAGADTLYKDSLSGTDTAYTAAKNDYDEGGEPATFKTAAESALLMYQALENACKATTMKERVEGLEFVQYNEAEYQKGCSLLDETNSLIASNNPVSQVSSKAFDTVNAFQAVLDSGFKTIGEEKRDDILTVKKDADSIKANKADADAYNNAVLLFNSGDTKTANKQYEEAYEDYSRSHTEMVEVYERVVQKKQAAEEAMARAKNKIDSIEQLAIEADEKAPLPDEEGQEEEAENE